MLRLFNKAKAKKTEKPPVSPELPSALQEKHEAAADRFARMPSSWLSDEQLNSRFKELMEKNPKSALFWPVGMSELCHEDLKQLHYLINLPEVDNIIIPVNSGNHWQPICMKKEPAKEPGKAPGWEIHKLVTKADGTCGQDSVEQAKRFIESRTTKDFQEKGGRVEPVADVFTTQIERAKTVSLTTVDAFDFAISRLADNDSDEARRSCEELLSKMNPDQIGKCIQRLYESGLGDKKQIQPIIEAGFNLLASDSPPSSVRP